MAQRPKEHVRSGIVAAAASLFAEIGYETTTMAAVAERAGSSVGNVYKYFGGKDELFQAVLPQEFAEDVKRRTEQRIKALGTVRDVRLLAPHARYHLVAGELLDHCLENRERVVILLLRAQGTRFESFADDFASKLVDWALEYARHAYPTFRPTTTVRFALRQIYENYLKALATTFATFQKPEVIRHAVSLLSAHHLGGLKHMFETVAAGEKTAARVGGTK